MPTRVLRIGVAVCLTLVTLACDDEMLGGPESWQCTVTLTLVPSTLGNLRSPSGSGSGTGTGGTREAALTAAYAQACSELPISGATLQTCRNGEDFTVEGGGQNNIRLLSAVDRSVRCSASN